MRIIKDKNNNEYVDQELFDYIKNIWLNYDQVIDSGSSIFFAKNCTVNRLVTDYMGKDISRVIRPDKADYLIIDKFAVSNYPQFFDGVSITDDDSKEVVYGIYNQSCEVKDTINLLLYYINSKQDIKFVNQNKLNESLNNGFIIDKNNYNSLKELIDSNFTDNHLIAINMLIASDLRSNWQWALYLYHGKADRISKYDTKRVFNNYMNSLGLGRSLDSLLSNIDTSFAVITDLDVQERFIQLIRSRFESKFESYMKESIGTSKFKLEDFKISYNG